MRTRTPSLDPKWFESRSKRFWTQHLLPLAPFRRYLEIGVFCGHSLEWATENLVGKEGESVGVDPYCGSLFGRTDGQASAVFLTAAKRVAGLAERGFTCKLVVKKSYDFFCDNHRNGKFDLIFVDGYHYAVECLTDICMAWQNLEVGGIMVVDDCHLREGERRRKRPEVAEAWKAFEACFRHRYEIVYRTVVQSAVRRIE